MWGIPFTRYSGTYAADRSEAIRDLSLVADLKKEGLLRWLEERKNNARRLSNDEFVRSSVGQLAQSVQERTKRGESEEEIRQDLLRDATARALCRHLNLVMKVHRVFRKIEVTDAATGLILASTDKAGLGTLAPERSFVDRMVGSGQDLAMEVKKDPVTGAANLITSHTVIAPEAGATKEPRASGAIALYIGVDAFLGPLFQTGGGLGQSGEMLLVNHEGTILMSLKHRPFGVAEAQISEHQITAKPAALAARGKEGIVLAPDYRGVPVVAAYRYVPVTPEEGWGLVVKMDEDEVFARLWNHIFYLTLIGFVGLLGTGIAATWMAGKVARPVENLSSAAQEVTQGNFHVRAPTDGSRELEVLSRAFNSMVQRIGDWHAHLTEEVQARTQALQESEERLGLALKGAQLGLWDYNPQTGEVVRDERAAEIYGYGIDEVKPTLELWENSIHPADRLRVVAAFQQHLEDATPFYEVEYRIISKSGQEKWVMSRGKVVTRDAEGNPARVAGTLVDITARKIAEEEVIRARDEWQRTFDAVPELIMILDRQRRVVQANRATAEALGISREELMGGQCFQSLHCKQAPPEFCPFTRMLADGKGHSSECFEEKLGGFFEIRVSPLKDSNDNVVGAVQIARDITKSKSLQEQLVRAQKMEAVGNLAGGIAHDFNNILQVVMGYAELLQADKKEDNPDLADLGRIRDAAKRGADLVKRLLTVSRKVEPEFRPTNLNQLVDNLEKLLTRTIPRTITIQQRLQDGLRFVNADPAQIEQVLLNLAINARDAMPDGGTLTIETANVELDQEYCDTHLDVTPGRHVLLTVSDSGFGIDKQTLARIFEPFFTTKEAGEGTGLGLAMVYSIVKQHGGQITCYSEPGRGTTFKIYLPAIETKTELPAPEKLVGPPGGTETILLVDDEEHIRELCARILARAGYTVLTAASGQEALELYEKDETISLTVLDLIMPAMDGRQCLREILELNPAARVLIASGHSLAAHEIDAMGHGAKGFVTKPYDAGRLLQAVREVLDKG
jgi:PAS domain S-box-containing protein